MYYTSTDRETLEAYNDKVVAVKTMTEPRLFAGLMLLSITKAACLLS
jgi:hypothetical protein